ncbi:ejaculatory bulb-specific protein 3-like isoform X1 [Bombus affinis]|uniref:Ejaculatory bulb-specific protein 3 isoform X1 n=1 Tax=Bombus terrestris TaxID=30195 RepID=A0A9B0C743_BOMTE|nr:ejaculatory bulb-specific protein 3 isoform X1 [Bombus terrestris]XP_050584959.1 ejaculatory bulb-specific protein 3-like isoform X1 [Bombus affinis]
MKIYLLLFTLVAVVCVTAEDYTTKYDNVDVDRILQNGRILTNYIKCMLDEGPCTNEGRELKKILPDALSTGCSKCNEKQKHTANKVVNYLRTKRPKDWERLSAKYDSSGEYKKRYENVLQPTKNS